METVVFMYETIVRYLQSASTITEDVLHHATHTHRQQHANLVSGTLEHVNIVVAEKGRKEGRKGGKDGITLACNDIS